MTGGRKRNLKRAGITVILAAIVALVIVAVTGGGSGKHARSAPATKPAATTPSPSTSAASGSEPVLSATEYRAKAAAICNELPNPAPSSSLQQAAPVVASQAAKASSAFAQLRALRPPAQMAVHVNQALGIMQQGVDVVGQLASAAQAGDQAGVQSGYEQLQGLAVAEHGIWKQIGVPEC